MGGGGGGGVEREYFGAVVQVISNFPKINSHLENMISPSHPKTKYNTFPSQNYSS